MLTGKPGRKSGSTEAESRDKRNLIDGASAAFLPPSLEEVPVPQVQSDQSSNVIMKIKV